jgi:NAD(P)-dependent dehydrogenase (short-subunit alcohol dehydrogenase family)
MRLANGGRFRGKVAFVTGGSSGIGAALSSNSAPRGRASLLRYRDPLPTDVSNQNDAPRRWGMLGTV